MMILKEEGCNVQNHLPPSFVCEVDMKNVLIAYSANPCDEKWVKTQVILNYNQNSISVYIYANVFG
jgi:hypothetical protein